MPPPSNGSIHSSQGDSWGQEGAGTDPRKHLCLKLLVDGEADLADLRNVVPQLVQLNILLPHDLLLQLRLVIDEIFVLPVGCSASRVGCCRHFASDSCETPAYLLDLQNHEEVFSHRWVGKDSCQTAQARGKVRGEAMKH